MVEEIERPGCGCAIEDGRDKCVHEHTQRADLASDAGVYLRTDDLQSTLITHLRYSFSKDQPFVSGLVANVKRVKSSSQTRVIFLQLIPGSPVSEPTFYCPPLTMETVLTSVLEIIS
jgi:hypothetical protein